jgi:hypothetical protein
MGDTTRPLAKGAPVRPLWVCWGVTVLIASKLTGLTLPQPSAKESPTAGEFNFEGRISNYEWATDRTAPNSSLATRHSPFTFLAVP